MAKHTTLEQLEKLATRTKTELDGLDTKIKKINDAGYQTATDVKAAIKAQVASTFKPGGSYAFNQLPEAGEDTLGMMYNITDEFTTTEDFQEGEGHKYPAGTNVAVVEVAGVYKYDAQAGFVDLSNYAKKTDIPEKYTHPTGDGNLHVPETGTENAHKVLTAGATAGSIQWGHKVEVDVPANAKFTDTTYAPFTGADESKGAAGLVPAPQVENKEQFLKGDGTWGTPLNTTYNDATENAHGLMSTTDKAKLDGIETATDGEIDAMLTEIFNAAE